MTFPAAKVYRFCGKWDERVWRIKDNGTQSEKFEEKPVPVSACPPQKIRLDPSRDADLVFMLNDRRLTA